MENLSIYEKARKVPQEALRPIQGGKLKGKSDINPMWRIKILTEIFGPCGFGWYTEEKEKWITEVNGEIIVNVSICLYVKQGGEWSKGILGYGGNMIAASNKNGIEANDEAYKMAYTDAISVACKALGIGADVYWDKDTTKYSRYTETKQEPVKEAKPVREEVQERVPEGELISKKEEIERIIFGTNVGWDMIERSYKARGYQSIELMPEDEYKTFKKRIILKIENEKQVPRN